MRDIEIANSIEVKDIREISKKIGLYDDALELYGKYKAKVSLESLDEINAKRTKGRLILVTAMTPTPYGEGKTTISIALADGLNKIGEDAALALREPSLGPVFGIKGGATGGGWAQVVPMEDINLHFTGDIHAIGAANNLVSACIDNHIKQGNELNIDVNNIVFKRCMDMNDRQLRHIVCGLGSDKDGVPREDGFDIAVASEIMAVLCLARSMQDLKERIARIIVAYDMQGAPVKIADLKIEGAVSLLLKDAIKPNLVQTLEGTPTFMHGGPFANIAHGCNSVIATKAAIASAHYAVTEAGFGADLGAEKFMDIKCRQAGISPNAVVIVATIRAIKYHGRNEENESKKMEAGIQNLLRHIDNVKNVYKANTVVAINEFSEDEPSEIQYLKEEVSKAGVEAVLVSGYEDGGNGAKELARVVADISQGESSAKPIYGSELGIKDKVDEVAKKIYRADAVKFSKIADDKAQKISELSFSHLPVCIAKTQYSFSDDANLSGAPTGFEITINDFKLCAGAGFIVAYAGNIMTMPGLPKKPAAEGMDIDEKGKITGLF